jgi:hypothetical protein
VTGLGEGRLPEGVAAEEPEAAALGLVEAAGEWLAVGLPPDPPQAVKSKAATRADLMGAVVRARVPIRKRPTPFCALGYVSGTIHAL